MQWGFGIVHPITKYLRKGALGHNPRVMCTTSLYRERAPPEGISFESSSGTSQALGPYLKLYAIMRVLMWFVLVKLWSLNDNSLYNSNIVGPMLWEKRKFGEIYDMLIEKCKSLKNALSEKVILLTGAGGGIGFEAAKAFAYMGAKVVIAEVDNKKGTYAEDYLNDSFSGHLVDFYKIDLADEKQIISMYDYINRKYGCPDVIFHNATITAMGAVEEVSLQIWDKSYAVNFRAPLLLTQLFLPAMKKRNSGIVVFVSSSGAAPYMGAYEVFKTAQVELCNTLSGELEKTNVNTFSIGPGLVKTETAMNGIKVVSNMMGMTIEEFYEMNEKHILGVEEAGCGFALSVLLAEKYKGQEIGSVQVLLEFGLLKKQTNHTSKKKIEYEKIIPLVKETIKIYKEQYEGWISRNIFERQWLLRDFKKMVGVSAEQFLINMKNLEVELEKENYQILNTYSNDFKKLRKYYERQYKLLQGFEKDPAILEKHLNTLNQWIVDLTFISERV